MKLFKNLFKKNKLNSEILCLVNLQDSIIMPPNSFFENDKNSDRNAILKNFITRLHNGENIENIKEEFAEKLNKVSALEIHNAMHELVESGMTIDEAKKFFYTRSLILQNAIDNEDINQNYKNNNK